MARISVTPDELRSQALTYTNQADNLESALQSLEQINSQIESEWDGDAFRAFQGEFESLHRPNLQKTTEALRDIKARIDQAAGNFEEQDASNSSMFGA